jgi:hypothetical protein
MPTPPSATSTPLAGSFIIYDDDYGAEGDIETARRLELPDGRIAFTIEYEDVDEQWELRIASRDGRQFRGTMSSADWDDPYAVEMTLWQAPDDESEWLLLGTFSDEETEEIRWSITLHVDDEDEDDEDEDEDDEDVD